MGITMDNVSSKEFYSLVSSNDIFMEHLEGHGIQIVTNVSAASNRVRCLTHILNLSVKDLLNSLKVLLNYEDAEEKDPDDLEDLDDENVS